MNIEHLARDDGQMVRQYEYDDESVLAVDFGPQDADASVDVVDDTVIVVVGDEQQEFDLPENTASAQAFMQNGVLTIELEEEDTV
ncbi:Hsp20/alpha crystallin family protein [Halobacteria archaeon AArc-m2/3/4]|uniref:Hsp20/alpha crystallin family protein n=1 Tax=Natronoglomus mannanivorans TaxID=2979990 RepID=A0AAP2YWK9_9EURY|nr:Hsp20/alpha crystallin family protein [Halobacteria archaeon AArc-xg1-1]MCU4971635.1 Hsp20/alpha crystallin family protein [Halobacteria archaeon AArc-m2/3/4]